MVEETASVRGRLLVASPTLLDPNFFRTVVLMVEHSGEGAAGVVLNRPTETTLEGALESWKPMAADPPLVFVGGPVQPDAAVCLARSGPVTSPAGFQPIVGGLGVLDLGREADEVHSDVDRLRVFAGYAGWGPGQLEVELDEGAWFVLDADPEDALTSMPGGLWRFVLERQGGKLAFVSTFPADPSMN